MGVAEGEGRRRGRTSCLDFLWRERSELGKLLVSLRYQRTHDGAAALTR